MTPRQPFGLLWSDALRRGRSFAKAQRQLRRKFEAASFIFMHIPPFAMAQVPMAHFDQGLLALFMLRVASNTDTEQPR